MGSPSDRSVLERDLRLPRPALEGQRLRALLERRGQGRGRVEVRADRLEERAQEGLGVEVGAARVELGAAAGELGDDGVVERDARAGRLDHRQRRQAPAAAGRREQGDHAAVRVADEVVAFTNALGDPVRVRLEVHLLDGPGRETGSLQDDELGLVGDRATLLAPGRAPSDDAPVDEDQPRRSP